TPDSRLFPGSPAAGSPGSPPVTVPVDLDDESTASAREHEPGQSGERFRRDDDGDTLPAVLVGEVIEGADEDLGRGGVLRQVPAGDLEPLGEVGGGVERAGRRDDGCRTPGAECLAGSGRVHDDERRRTLQVAHTITRPSPSRRQYKSHSPGERAVGGLRAPGRAESSCRRRERKGGGEAEGAEGRGMREVCQRAQRSVTETPSSASSVRRSGRLMPTTPWWSPSMPVTKGPPSPS